MDGLKNLEGWFFSQKKRLFFVRKNPVCLAVKSWFACWFSLKSIHFLRTFGWWNHVIFPFKSTIWPLVKSQLSLVTEIGRQTWQSIKSSVSRFVQLSSMYFRNFAAMEINVQPFSLVKSYFSWMKITIFRGEILVFTGEIHHFPIFSLYFHYISIIFTGEMQHFPTRWLGVAAFLPALGPRGRAAHGGLQRSALSTAEGRRDLPMLGGGGCQGLGNLGMVLVKYPLPKDPCMEYLPTLGLF